MRVVAAKMSEMIRAQIRIGAAARGTRGARRGDDGYTYDGQLACTHVALGYRVRRPAHARRRARGALPSRRNLAVLLAVARGPQSQAAHNQGVAGEALEVLARCSAAPQLPRVCPLTSGRSRASISTAFVAGSRPPSRRALEPCTHSLCESLMSAICGARRWKSRPPQVPDPPLLLKDDRRQRPLRACQGREFATRREVSVRRLILNTRMRRD